MAEPTTFAGKSTGTGVGTGRGTRFAGARLAVFKRAKGVVVLPILTALLALAVVSVLPNRYAASALVQVDPPPAAAAELSTSPSPSAPNSIIPPAFEAERLGIEDQIAILNSPQLLDRIVASLRLTGDPEFKTRPLAARIAAPLQDTNAETIAREALAARLSIRRVHNSSLINIGMSSLDPAKATKIANAVATEYIAQVRAGALAASPAKKTSSEPTASEKAFASMLQQYGLGRSLTGARIVEVAKLPEQAAGPKRARIVAATALSTIVLMLALAVLLERDARLRTRRVEKMLSCPHMTSLPALFTDDSVATLARRARLIIAEPGCRYADAVRATCHELSTRNHDDTPRVIMIVSALADEGAEPFASNIAHQLAVAGQKALLVDCDFHNRRLTRQLTPTSQAGLLDQIAKHAPVENVILRDNLTGVHFLPASGVALPLMETAALRSVSFTTAFQHLKARFPTIVISAPPLLETSDAQVLAELADQIVFLTAWHRTPRALAKKAVSLLDANQRKIVGAVLADISDDREAGFMSFAAMFDEIRRAARFPAVDRAA
jgi:succinoglycan biosynthesis transport protein ExoP